MGRVVSIKLYLVWMLLLGSVSAGFSQNLLHKKASISETEITVSEVLKSIEKQCGVYFAFNSSLIDEERVLSVIILDETIEKIIDNLFDKRVEGVHRGSYVILRERKKSKQPIAKIQVKGTITDKASGKILEKATVYEVANLSASSSDSSVPMDLEVSAGDDEILMAVSLQNYQDTVISISRLSPNFEVSLRPDSAFNSQTNSSIDERKALAMFSTDEALQSMKNVHVSESKFFQFSVLPFLGSNRFFDGTVKNNVSINLIAGLNQNISGFEIGGAFNFVRSNMNGLQMAGVGNHTQVASGLQMGGVYNKTDTLRGMQVGSAFNHSVKANGFQLSGCLNNSQELNGAQVSGVLSKSKEASGIQISGVLNQAKKLDGIQIGGVWNEAEEVKGVQISGLVNRTKTLRGIQFSPINICDTVESGFTFGLLNFVKTGISDFELESTDMFHTQVNYKSGTRKFYNIISACYRMEGGNSRFGYGLGIGSQRNISQKLFSNLEVIAMANLGIDDVEKEKGSSVDIRLSGGVYLNQKKQQISFGPILHFYFKDDSSPYLSSISDVDFALDDSKVKPWIGYRIGFQF